METKLKVKTRRNETTQDKAKVFFACHQDDFDEYFESVTDEILAKQNCAIFYYLPTDTIDYNERMMDLSEIQLFVFPVTEKFLINENDARNIDFKFAMENKKAILPLLQEMGIETLFNDICGDIQFLNKFDADPTAISYNKKLGDFLSAVLLSDEQIKKIKDAFDAYIFLSYRKKDRRYAKDIMKLIHENDFCRDVAIWYDEFLLPGEDFNQAIQNAIDKSNLFTLVVTPNLNEPNYIQENEYPAASSRNMPILPIEAVNTNRTELEQLYKNLPVCTPAEDKIKISHKLGEYLKGIALRSDSSPEHNFLIGLAYLAGIDVETDNEKAVELIESAASSGLKPAIKKIADMYRVGEGVPADYIRQTYWVKKLVEIVASEYNECNTPEKREEYLELLVLLARLYHTDGNYNYILQFGEEVFCKFKDERLSYNEELIMTALRLIVAQAKLKNSDFEGAQKIYKEISDIFEAEGDEHIADYALMLASCYNNQLALCRESKQYDSVVEIANKAMTLCQKMFDINPNEFLGLMASNLSITAWIFIDMGDDGLEDAELFMKQAIEIERALRDDKEERFGITLARDYDNLGNIYLRKMNNIEAGKMYFSAKRILDNLRKDNKNLFLSDAAVNLNNIAQWHRGNDDTQKAVECYLEAIDINKILCEDNAEAYEPSLARMYMNLGDAYTELEKYGRAKRNLDESVTLKKKYELPGVPCVELAESYLCMAVMYFNQKNAIDTVKYLDMCEKIFDEADKVTPGSCNHLRHKLYAGRAKLNIALMDFEAGFDNMDKANKLLIKLARKNPVYYECNIANNYSFLQQVHLSRNDVKKAISAGDTALFYRRRVLKHMGIEYDKDTAEHIKDLGLLYSSNGGKAQAKRLLIEAKSMYEKLSEDCPFEFDEEISRLERCINNLK